MILEEAIRVALVNAEAAAALSRKLSSPNRPPETPVAREEAYELIQVSGNLLCAARELEARVLGVPEARRGV